MQIPKVITVLGLNASYWPALVENDWTMNPNQMTHWMLIDVDVTFWICCDGGENADLNPSLMNQKEKDFGVVCLILSVCDS